MVCSAKQRSHLRKLMQKKKLGLLQNGRRHKQVTSEIKVEAEVKREVVDDEEIFGGNQSNLEELQDLEHGLAPEDRRCLVCCKPTMLTLQDIRSVKPEEWDSFAQFVLKRMLEVPEEKLEEFGGLTMGNSRNWMMFCKKCRPVIVKAFKLQKQINSWEKRLHLYQAEVVGEIKASCGNGKGIDASMSESEEGLLPVIKHVRTFVATGLWETSKTEPDEYPTLETEPRTEVPSLPSSTPSDSNDDMETGCHADNHCLSLITPETDSLWNEVAETVQLPILEQRMLYTCVMCFHIGPLTLESFVKHLVLHYERPYRCKQCNSFFTGSEEEVNNFPVITLESENGTEEQHKCTMESLERVKLKTGLIWRCAHCLQKFEREEERRLHEHQTHSERSEVNEPFGCQVCSRKFRSREEWLLHRSLEHMEIARFGCNFCEKTFSVRCEDKEMHILDRVALQNHIKDVHETTDGQAIFRDCYFCGRNFSLLARLTKHIKEEHGKNLVDWSQICPVCFKGFPNNHNCQRHLDNAHIDKSHRNRVLVCENCGYTNTQKYLMQEHKFGAHGIVPEKGRPVLECDKAECGFQTTMKAVLEKHKMKEHGAERKFRCQVCGKGFLDSKKLACHTQIHANAGNRPFQCEICGNSFAVKNHLYIHKRLTHQSRPFPSTNKNRPSWSHGKKGKRDEKQSN